MDVDHGLKIKFSRIEIRVLYEFRLDHKATEAAKNKCHTNRECICCWLLLLLCDPDGIHRALKLSYEKILFSVHDQRLYQCFVIIRKTFTFLLCALNMETSRTFPDASEVF